MFAPAKLERAVRRGADCQEVACTGTNEDASRRTVARGSRDARVAKSLRDAPRWVRVTRANGATGGVAAGSSFMCEATAGADPTWVWTGCNTPLVLSFDGASVDFTHPSGVFDLAGRGVSVDTDWVTARTPWLVLDRNANGAVDDGSELSGSMTPLTTGARATNGFVALADLDDDADGVIFLGRLGLGHLLLWRDLNQNRVSSPNELTLARDEGLELIALANRVQPRCTATACEMQRSRFMFRDGLNEREGEVIDVYFQDR